MAITNITVRTEICQGDSCVRYVIVYTNDRTVQGHHIYCLVSKVNIFSQGNHMISYWAATSIKVLNSDQMGILDLSNLQLYTSVSELLFL